MPISVPKKRLVQEIMVLIPDLEIRAFFRIGPTPSTENALSACRKAQLIEIFHTTPERTRHLQALEMRYPLGNAGTFYLPKVERNRYTETLPRRIGELAELGREIGYFQSDMKVRAVYVEGQAEIIETANLVEIPLIYESRLEYQIGDPPDADDYGEWTTTYSLEHGLIWLMDDHSHGVIYCTGLAAMQAILLFGEIRLGLDWTLPNMTKEMFIRLTTGTDPTSVTYGSIGYFPGIPTITLSDPALPLTQEFKQLEEDYAREQRAGFYRGAEDSPFPSFGIARRHARIWTPWQFSKQYLAASMRDFISRTEKELKNEYTDNLPGYVSYFENASVDIGQARLKGRDRHVFQQLMEAIVTATKDSTHENDIGQELLSELLQIKTHLHLQAVSTFECDNCGGGLGRCPECLYPYEARYEHGRVVLMCPKCKRCVQDGDNDRCECGTQREIYEIPSYLLLIPEPPLVDAITKFISLMDEVQWPGFFVIDGTVLKLLEPKTRRAQLPSLMRLEDLRYWQTEAHYHLLSPERQFIKVLNHTKEKCLRNGVPPNRTRCEACLGTTIQTGQIWLEGELCLPRLMGLAIHRGFDGIHHGYEVADVKYDDFVVKTDEEVSVGIHLKSRVIRPKSEGEGRSTRAVKALYTQVFYSAYLALTSKSIDFDVIGISMPNIFHQGVITSISELLNRLGFSLLVIEEDDWLKIVAVALKELESSESLF